MHTHHHNAKTNIFMRLYIRENPDGLTVRVLAERFMISEATVRKWMRRDRPEDASCRPEHIGTAFTLAEQEIIVELRRRNIALDAITDAIQEVVPGASRSSVHRLLKRRTLNRLPKPAKEPHGAYSKAIAPGFLHIDSFKLVRVVGQSVSQHCFVAVDRATRMVLIGVYDRHDGTAACDFLKRCQAFFPFELHTIVTDNGGEYTCKATCPPAHAKGVRRPFEIKCAEAGIEHRTIKPYTPKTNGLVERMNGEIQNKVTKGRRYETVEDRDCALRAWNDNYNKVRRNRNIPIGLMTPLEASSRWFEMNKATLS